jgi:hypothetical protein
MVNDDKKQVIATGIEKVRKRKKVLIGTYN